MSLWLKQYYGPKWFGELHPSIYIEGKDYAVVRVAFPRKQAHVLIRKNGRHDNTPHEVLHEGMPKAEDYIKMKARLVAVDRK